MDLRRQLGQFWQVFHSWQWVLYLNKQGQVGREEQHWVFHMCSVVELVNY
jgi:hypothetical protein